MSARGALIFVRPVLLPLMSLLACADTAPGLENAPDAGSSDLAEAGWPPCTAVELVPNQLNFGAVQRTRSLRRSFALRNLSDQDCEFELVHVCENGAVAPAPGLSMLPDRGFLPARANLLITIEIGPFDPWPEDPNLCPSACGGTLELRSAGTEVAAASWSRVLPEATFLLVPSEIRMSTRVGCTLERTLSLYNPSASPSRWVELREPDPSLGFEIDAPPLPIETEPGVPLVVPIRFSPTAEGEVEAQLELTAVTERVGCFGPEMISHSYTYELKGIAQPPGPCGP